MVRSSLALLVLTLGCTSLVLSQRCGKDYGGTTCTQLGYPTYCCSSAGYCGTDTAWCGPGCQPAASANNCFSTGSGTAPPSNSPNLLKDPSFENPSGIWSAFGNGYNPSSTAHDGSQSISCSTTSTTQTLGAYQTVTLGQTSPSTITVSGWSLSSTAVSGSSDYNYGVYVDTLYTDNTWLYGSNAPFSAGAAHGWEFKSVTITPTKPIASINVYALFRSHSGTVLFDQFSVTAGNTPSTPAPTPSPIPPYSSPTTVRTRLGRPQFVGGPGGAPFDNDFFTLNVGSTIRGYSANGNTVLINNGNINTALSPPYPIALYGGTGGKTGTVFDSCGSWLNSAIIDGNIVRGWYHAETSCYYENSQTLKSVAYCESTDGGVTYTKINYPNNQVLTGGEGVIPNQITGNGDHSVLLLNGYYYMFYINWHPYSYCVARATKASGGVPGSWLKYYNGDYTQNGKGGLCSPIPNIGASDVVQIAAGGLLAVNTLSSGVSMSFGSSPTQWVAYPEMVMFQGGRGPNLENFEYASFVPLDGVNAPLSNSFWLYYTYLNPGEGEDKRFLVRRTVDFQVLSTAPLAQSAVELSRWVLGSDYWTTVQMVPTTYSYDANLGYLPTTQKSGMNPLYDCNITAWGSHILTSYLPDCNQAGFKFIRQLGFIYTTQVTGTHALYRCFNSNTNHHYASTSQSCDGRASLESTLGFVLDINN